MAQNFVGSVFPLSGLYSSSCDHTDAGYMEAGSILSQIGGWLTLDKQVVCLEQP